MSENKTFEGWCILELFGHRRLTGYVTEEQHFGFAMIRIDVPGGSEAGGESVSQLYSPQAHYALTPTTEERARAFATRHKPQPVSRYELPAPLDPENGGVDEDEWSYEDESPL